MGKKRIIQKSVESQESKFSSAGGKSDEVNQASTGKGEVKISRKVARGIANIQATYNNTLITITDEKGNVLGWSSAGSVGFSGTKKATPFAAARVAEAVAAKVRRYGLESLRVRVSGVGSGRDSAIRALSNQGFNIVAIKDVTPLAHNGPRPRKPRRV
jgi:small subunit ribosomal protein S11